MTHLDFSPHKLQEEKERIKAFIRDQSAGYNLVLGLSGGVDSDVCARLVADAVGPERMKCFTVLQSDFDSKYVANAHHLAHDIGTPLVEIPLADVPAQLISALADSDPAIGFVKDPTFLDVGRSKCAIRTFVFSAYAERGHLVIGPSNRTEFELGYFLPFGDGLAHIRPIIHLYKTQVLQLANALGTRPEVISQQPAAGFWIGDEDLRGIAYWLYNEAPIQIDLKLSTDEKAKINRIRDELSFHAIDSALIGIAQGLSVKQIAEESHLSIDTAKRICALAAKANEYKRRTLGVSLL